MPSMADRQGCAHAHLGGRGREGAASTPLDVQGLGPPALQISVNPCFEHQHGPGPDGAGSIPTWMPT